MATSPDLSAIGVVDNHCHALDADQRTGGVLGWRARFTESPHERMRTVDVAETAFYRRLIRRTANHLGLPPDSDEQVVLGERDRRTTLELTSSMYADAHIDGVVIDTGYPPPEQALTREAHVAATGTARVDLLRLEVLFQQLIASHVRCIDVVEELTSRLSDVRAAGYAGLKSIAGYRTGLSIERWSGDEIDAAFARARREAEATGAVRLGYKPLLDSLLHVSLESAARQVLPVQFVLLHGCWPYFREGAYLAAVYENAYLDLSFGIPFLSIAELTSMTRAALGTAPFTKVMYSSDGTRVPELHWMGAHDGRRFIARVLSELVDDGDLDRNQVMAAADLVLGANAWKLYGFTGSRS